MQRDNEELYVRFHNQANNTFFNLLQTFESAAQKINRQTEEYKYQQVKDTYINTLKHQLEESAARLMEEHQQNKNRTELSQNLQQFIIQYLHLFVQKTRTA